MVEYIGKLTTTSGRVLFGDIVLVNEDTGASCVVRDGKVLLEDDDNELTY